MGSRQGKEAVLGQGHQPDWSRHRVELYSFHKDNTVSSMSPTDILRNREFSSTFFFRTAGLLKFFLMYVSSFLALLSSRNLIISQSWLEMPRSW